MTTTTLTLTRNGHWEYQTFRDSSLERERPSESHAWLIGLDLGRMNDYTAAVVVECIEPGHAQSAYHVRQILRVRNKPYPQIVSAVQELLASPDLRDASLIVDGTGVGVAVVDMFRATGTVPIGITITAGFDHERVIGGYHVPKRALVSIIEVLLQHGRVHIAAELPLTPVLTQELSNFEVRISAAGRDTYSAREGEHDDLVLATAMALWYGELPRPHMWFI
jgi:hypothetical protein